MPTEEQKARLIESCITASERVDAIVAKYHGDEALARELLQFQSVEPHLLDRGDLQEKLGAEGAKRAHVDMLVLIAGRLSAGDFEEVFPALSNIEKIRLGDAWADKDISSEREIRLLKRELSEIMRDMSESGAERRVDALKVDRKLDALLGKAPKQEPKKAAEMPWKVPIKELKKRRS